MHMYIHATSMTQFLNKMLKLVHAKPKFFKSLNYVCTIDGGNKVSVLSHHD